MKLFTTLALAASLAAPAAFAGGMAEPAPEPYIAPVVVAPVTMDWSGFYAGVQLGYGDVSSKNVLATDLDGNGVIGGIHAGYRHDFGQFVAGVELAYNASDIDIGSSITMDRLSTLKLMGGYDTGPALIYVSAGAAETKLSGGLPGFPDGSDNGWVVGIGMDYAINDAWTIGGELTHNRFDDFNGSGVDVRANLLQLKAGYRF